MAKPKTPKPSLCYLNATFYFKNPPEAYRGIVSTNYQIGDKDVPTPLSKILAKMVVYFCDFYLATMQHMTSEEVNAELDMFRRMISDLKVTDVPKEGVK